MQPKSTTITITRQVVQADVDALGFEAGLALPRQSVSLAGRCVRVHVFLQPFLGTSVGDCIIQLEPLGFDASKPKEWLDSARQTCQKIIETDTNLGVVESAKVALAELNTVVEPEAVKGIDFTAEQTTPSGKYLFRTATTDGHGRAVLTDLFLDRPCTLRVFNLVLDRPCSHRVFSLDLDKVFEPFEPAREAFSMQGAFAAAAEEGGAETFPTIRGTLAKWGFAYNLDANGPNACFLALATPLEQKEAPPAMILYLGAKHQLPLEWQPAVGGGFVCAMSIPIPAAMFAKHLQHPLLIRLASS